MEAISDIGIYINSPMEQVVKWISSVVGLLNEDTRIGNDVFIYSCSFGKVIVTSNDEDSFVEVSFHTPGIWKTGAECARQAARELRCKVHCDPGADYPEVNPHSDVMLEIDATTEPIEERLFVSE